MERNQAGLAEFCASNGQQALRPIDILRLQVDGLAETHAAYRQQPEQAAVCPRTQAGPRKILGGLQKLANLIIRIEVGLRALRRIRQQSMWWNFGCWICAAAVRGKLAHDRESNRPLFRFLVLVSRGELECELGSDTGHAFLFEK